MEVVQKLELTLEQKAVALYAVTAVFGTAVQHTHILDFAKKWYLISSRSFINLVFANNAYIFVGVLLVAVTALLVADHRTGPILPLNAGSTVSTEPFRALVIRRVVKFVVVYVDLNMVLSHSFGIFHLVTEATQHCSNSAYKSYEECLAGDEDATWYPGVDPSGHYFLLLTVSLIAINDLTKVADIRTHLPWKKGIMVCGCVLLVVWYELFLTTSLFYHTVLEKLLGFATGVAVTMCINRFL